MSIGERIIEQRKLQNISQDQLAQALSISRQAVSKWENDLSCPDTLNLIKLAELLDTDIEYLATGRRTYGRRPPVVIKTVETVEKVVEKPVIQYVQVPVEVEKPVIQYIDKPVVRKMIQIEYRRSVPEYATVGAVCFLLGILIGFLF